MVSVINLWGLEMNSIKNLLITRIFQSILMIFLLTIFLLNIAFYFFSNDQYQKEIQRQYDALYTMTAHLSTEENFDTLEVYLEHYTHTNDVIIHFKDHDQQSVFTNDTTQELTEFEPVHYQDTLVGYLAVNFESSRLGKDILYAFLWLNAISITLLSLGTLILYRFLVNENKKIQHDLSSIGQKDALFSYQEIHHIHTQVVNHQEQKMKQKHAYESHIKSIAHDIKTPLSVIQIYNDSLIEGKLSPTKEVLNDMKEEIDKINTLIPKFIESEYRALPYSQDITLYIKKFAHDYKEVFDRKEIRIDLHLESLSVYLSDQHVKRLIDHLLFNAFYYAYPHSVIYVTTNQDQRKLIIKDQGIGMSKETISMIFQGPYRSHEATLLNEKGSGIGFQIVRQIVEDLKATLSIDSEVNQGTTITIQF